MTRSRPAPRSAARRAPARKRRRPSPVRLAVAQAYLAFGRGEPFRGEPPPALADEPERRLYVQLLRGLVRHRRLLEAEVARLAGRPAARLDAVLLALAALGLYQLRFLDVPPHAAVYETVELSGALGRTHGRGLVNGVLRATQREGFRGEATPEPLPLAVRTSHPDWLVERWLERFGPGPTEVLCEANNRFEGAGVRVETGRISPEALLARLAADGVPAQAHPLLPGALWVEQLGPLLRSPAFAEGLCYVQDVGSQLLVAWAAPLLAGRVLDACAAPGGKLTHLLGLPAGARRLVGADRALERLARVRENVARLRLPAPPLVLADGRRLPFPDAAPGGGGPGWDAVLLDVPCSATGMVRKYPELKWRKHAEDLPRLAEIQGALLAEAARVVRPGGWLVYVTCSLEREENEDGVAGFLAGHPDFARVPFHTLASPPGLGAAPASLLNAEGDLLLLPGARRMGLYAALLRRGSAAAGPGCPAGAGGAQ